MGTIENIQIVAKTTLAVRSAHQPRPPRKNFRFYRIFVVAMLFFGIVCHLSFAREHLNCVWGRVRCARANEEGSNAKVNIIKFNKMHPLFSR